MRYGLLGRTGLRVSRVALGTVEIGMDYGVRKPGGGYRPDRAEIGRFLHGALDRGINLIDTARAYGESEELIGEAIGGRREEYVLATKVGQPPAGAGPGDFDAHVDGSVRASLAALRTDEVEIMMLHSAPVEEIRRGAVRESLEKWKQRGAVRFVGASVYGEEAALAAIRSGQYDCLQVAASMLDRRGEVAVFGEAAAAGVAIVARSVLLRGVLTRHGAGLRGTLPALGGAVEKLEGVAGGFGLELEEMAYRYFEGMRPPDTVLAGTAFAEELDQIVGWVEKGRLPEDVLSAIGSITCEDREQLNPSNWPAGA